MQRLLGDAVRGAREALSSSMQRLLGGAMSVAQEAREVLSSSSMQRLLGGAVSGAREAREAFFSPSLQRLLGATVRGAREAREALSSSSSTRLRQRTGVHLHRIDHYSKVHDMIPRGECIKSAAFRVDGHKWKLHFYPASKRDVASVELILKERYNPWWRLDYSRPYPTVAWKVSILDGSGRPAFGGALVGPERVSWCGSSAGAMVVATAEELRSAVRSWKDDAIVVRCDLTVMSLEKESGIKWCLRRLVSKFS